MNYKNEEMVKQWANTTHCKKFGDVLVVKHYQDNLWYIFQKEKSGGYELKMTAISLQFLEE